MAIDIVDRPGRYQKAEMRKYFEQEVAQTKVLAANTPLGAVTVNGEFSHYADPDTDTMWLGFAVGMLTAQRLARAQVSA